jgi:hypothetical protein
VKFSQADTVSKDSFGLTNSDAKTKKLYAVPAESTTNVDELLQRSNSNAARVAKLFGYANAAPIQSLPNPKDSSMQAKFDIMQAKSQQQKRNVARVGKPSISSLDDIMSMLENETLTASPASSPTETTKKPVRGSRKATAGKSSLSSLDEMMISLENIMVTPDQARILPPLEKKEIVRDSIEERATTENPSLGRLGEKMSSLGQNWGMGSSDRKASFSVGSAAQPIQKLADPTRKVGGMKLDTAINPVAQPKTYYASPVSFTSSESTPFVTALEEETESTGKPLTEYMKEAEEMRLEREQMELVRRRILEEELVFQREAEKFAEEEEQMRKFVENLKLEEERDVENQERKQRIAEEQRRKEDERRKEEEEVTRRKEEEKKHLQELEDERLVIETAERLNMENERIESERQEREARAFKERAEMERAKYVEEEARLKTQRMEDERIVREEQATRDYQRAAEENAERLRIEKEEAQRTSQRREDERFAQEQRRVEREQAQQLKFEEEQAERLRIEKEGAQRNFRRREDERLAQEQRLAEREQAQQLKFEEEQASLEAQRREDERTERLRYEEEDSEPETLTKEQEMQKAEEKIRAAFAGLAQERDQISMGVKPAGSGPKVDRGGLSMTGKERGIARYNTVGGGPRPRQEQPFGVSRGNTVGVRTNKSVGGGLPTGPKAGFGLPGRPNVGLPSGPRPRGKV